MYLIDSADGRPKMPIDKVPVQVIGVASFAAVPATTIQGGAVIPVTSAGAALVAANPARRALRFRNIGTDQVAIGSPAIAWAARVIVLGNGDVWVEDDAANLAWSAICDTGKTATVTVQEILS